MIRRATVEDYAEIFYMAVEFKIVSPYADLPISDQRIIDCLSEALQSDDYGVFIAEEGNESVGFVVGMLTKTLFSESKVAGELAWWVKPESRSSGIGIELLKAYEQWAKEAGAKLVSVSLLENDDLHIIDKIYTKAGYTPVERSYIKEL